MGIDGKSSSKCTPARVKNCLKTFLVHLFSHVGLCVLVVGYAVIGGFIFKALENDTVKIRKAKLDDIQAKINETLTRKRYVSNLWNITDRFNVLYELHWKQEVEAELARFQEEVKNTSNKTDTKIKELTYTDALYYSVSIITTIGYGDIFPHSAAGKVFTMVYAVIGVPLMLLWVSNIGNVMAHAFKFAYFQGPFCSSSTRNSNRYDSKRKTVQSQRLNKNKKSKGEKSGNVPPADTGVSTQVEFSLNNEKCETVILEQNSSPTSQRSPSTPTKRSKGSRCSRESKKSLKDLDPTTRQILLECAEYNLSHGDEMDSRSQEILQQLNSSEGRDEVDDADTSRRSSDVESVIEIISSSHGRFNASTMIPPPPTFDIDTDTLRDEPLKIYDYIHETATVKRNGSRKISVIDSLQLPHGTPSKIPLLEDRDAIDIEIVKVEAEGFTENPSERKVPVSLVLFVVVLYIGFGAVMFNLIEENWDFLDSAYFCFITLSTIGLGDLTPGSSLKKWDDKPGQRESTVQLILCCFYLVIGLAIIAMSFNLVQEQVTIKVKEFARRIGIIEDD